MPNEQPLHSEAAAFVLRALEQSSQPLTVTKLGKALPKSALKTKKDLPELLQLMVKDGQIRSHKARSPVYWLPNLEEQASARILEALSEIPLTQTELKNKLRSLLLGWPPSRRDELLARLIKEKRVYKLPPLTGKANLLSARPADPKNYLQKPISEIVSKLQRLSKELSAVGVPPETFFAVAQQLWLQAMPVTGGPPSSTAVNFDQTVLDAILRLNPAAATGAPVQLSELRHAVLSEIADKVIFDQVVLRLAEQGRVAVHRHDYASSLNQEERAALVSDGRGNYFIGVTLRA